jgi:hypothetical protein
LANSVSPVTGSSPFSKISAHADHGERDLLAVGLAAHQGRRELARLLEVDLGRQRRLERIDHRLDEGRSRRRERAVEHGTALRGILDREAGDAARLRDELEVDGLKVAAVLGIAEEHHLLPLDLAERVVLDDDHFDGQLIADARGELGHQHRHATVADERHHLPLRIG